MPDKEMSGALDELHQKQMDARRRLDAVNSDIAQKLFYVISVNHTRREDRYVLLWRPDDKGYTFRTSTAGRYPQERILTNLGYYNTGCAAIAVPADVIDPLTVMTTPRDQFDGPDGPALLNTRANWKILLANTIAKPSYRCEPEYKGAPRRKEVA